MSTTTTTSTSSDSGGGAAAGGSQGGSSSSYSGDSGGSSSCSTSSDSPTGAERGEQHVEVTGANADPQVLQHFWDLASLQQVSSGEADQACVRAAGSANAPVTRGHGLNENV
jgi:hypothetical protein